MNDSSPGMDKTAPAAPFFTRPVTSNQLKALAAVAEPHPVKDLGRDHPSIHKQTCIAIGACRGIHFSKDNILKLLYKFY